MTMRNCNCPFCGETVTILAHHIEKKHGKTPEEEE
ncbi:hypothetical protein SAMN05192552_105013 [Natrinema hispanicum]|uniref:C2H2-type domain-containing protein n=1 Tax=Natrinema hispanicum TaxID=392421 RepID=A0A1G6XQF9_9EURY|nr:hypothetical protein SAMN05192552_105013 [Natrinema hispanicum]